MHYVSGKDGPVLGDEVYQLIERRLFRMTEFPETGGNRWLTAWPDALAFVSGLALAWFNDWQTKDLVWSLWLSSLVVGYAMIVWNIFGPSLVVFQQMSGGGAPPLAKSALGGIYFVGGLLLLAFFTVHFGGFHFVHSVFLNTFFPMTDAGPRGFPGLSIYWQVVREYWPFVLVAAVAERQAFKPATPNPADDTAVTAAAIKARKTRGSDKMMGPYKNVIRLHLLIFFFAFASFAKMENFLVYAVVYAVYFFPWRLLKKA